MLTSTSISAPLPPLRSKRKLKPKAPNTAAIWDNLASARGYKGKGKEKEQDWEITEEEKEKAEEPEKEKKTTKEKENANEIGEKDLNGKEVSLPIDIATVALKAQTNSTSLQPVSSISTQGRKRKMGSTTTISENREKQTRFAPLLINGHTSCPPTSLLDESISTGLSRRSSRLLKEPNAKKPPPEVVKPHVSPES